MKFLKVKYPLRRATAALSGYIAEQLQGLVELLEVE